jgi:hypothetical protein
MLERNYVDEVSNSLRPGFGLHPVGRFDNSPPFQRWVAGKRCGQVPAGTKERRAKIRQAAIFSSLGEADAPSSQTSAVPRGTHERAARPNPTVETVGYCRMSLRDKESHWVDL